MGIIELDGIFKAKNKTAAQWASENPILRDGELGHEKDTHKSKIGDGVTAWNNLPYDVGAGGNSAERLSCALEITDFADFPDTAVFEKPGDIVSIYAPDASNQPDGATGHMVGFAQAYEAWVSGGAENYILYSVMDTSSGKAYSGKTTAAGGYIEWTASGGGETTAPVRINEYGAIYDNGTFINLPSGAIVSWYADNSGADGDMGPFKGEATSVRGIYIAIDGSEKPSSRSGMLVAYRADGEKGMATCYIYGTKEQGGVMNADDWAVYTPGDSAQNSLPFDGPIPGYELVYSDTSAVLQLASGTEVAINFDKKLTLSQLFGSKARFMIEASIISVSGSTHTLAVPVPITIFKPAATGSQPVFEYMSQSLATGTNIARVKLIVTSWIRESGGVTGCNLMVQTNNLNSSMNYALTFPGMYVKSSGGGQ